MSDTITLALRVGIEDVDADAVDRATRGLRRELDELGVDARLAEPASPSTGAKGDAVTLGVIALAVLPEFAPKLVAFLQAWLERGSGRTIRVEVKDGERSVKLELPPRAAPLDTAMAFVERVLDARPRTEKSRG